MATNFLCQINNVYYEVIECSNNDTALSDSFLLGRTYYFDRKIYINKDLESDKKEETLRHELTHAFIHETQIINQEENFNYTEEMVCEFVAKYGKQIDSICRTYRAYKADIERKKIKLYFGETNNETEKQ